jgi:hypothetical protein
VYYGGATVPLTVRLSAKTERTLDALAKRKHLSRSEVVREALARYGAANEDSSDTGSGPYGSWFDVIGVVKLGARDPRRTTGEQFTAVVQEQARARRTR